MYDPVQIGPRTQVHMDDYIMSFFMVEALLRKGYKHIIHIPGPDRKSVV